MDSIVQKGEGPAYFSNWILGKAKAVKFSSRSRGVYEVFAWLQGVPINAKILLNNKTHINSWLCHQSTISSYLTILQLLIQIWNEFTKDISAPSTRPSNSLGSVSHFPFGYNKGKVYLTSLLQLRENIEFYFSEKQKKFKKNSLDTQTCSVWLHCRGLGTGF